MKSTIEGNEREVEYSYPCLKESDHVVTLFTGEGIGTVVYKKLGGYHVGYYSTTWDQSLFSPYHGRVILENK